MPRLRYDIQGPAATDEIKARVGSSIDRWLSERGLNPLQACHAWDNSDDVYHEEFHAAVEVASIEDGAWNALSITMYVDFD